MSSNEIMTKEFLSDLRSVLVEQNQAVLGKVSEVSKKVDVMDGRLDEVERTTTYLMNERPITRSQSGRLRAAISRRVCILLNVPEKKKERTIEQQIKYEKYSKSLFGKCYSEIPGNGHMAKSSYLDTPACDYDKAMHDIEIFVPASGMTDFYAEVDRLALAKKIAKEQGY